MNRIITLIVLIFLYCNLMLAQDSTYVKNKLGERIPVPGTYVSIKTPTHFTYSEKSKAFIHSGSAASLSFTEAIGTSWIQVCQNMNTTTVGDQKAQFIEELDVELANGYKGKLFVVKFTVTSNDSTKYKLDFERMMLFTGDYNYTVWINASYPSTLRTILYDVIKASMLSVEINEAQLKK